MGRMGVRSMQMKEREQLASEPPGRREGASGLSFPWCCRLSMKVLIDWRCLFKRTKANRVLSSREWMCLHPPGKRNSTYFIAFRS